MTKDRRILIRNTAEVHNPYKMSQSDLEKDQLNKKLGQKDFHNYQMTLFNLRGQALFQELEIALRFLKKFRKIFLLLVVIMVLE